MQERMRRKGWRGGEERRGERRASSAVLLAFKVFRVLEPQIHHLSFSTAQVASLVSLHSPKHYV